ncbi:MAG: hypothetical protein J2P26_09095 [Nocardiopsaceae bacterium]|nr:hypothetical protein [Nocardiopsaceae bacterium]
MTHPASTVAAPSGPGNGPSQPRPGAPRCRIPGCPAPVSTRRLMCRPHWYQVPKHLRDQVWATWRSGAGILDPAYRQAVRQAVATVHAAAGTGDPP